MLGKDLTESRRSGVFLTDFFVDWKLFFALDAEAQLIEGRQPSMRGSSVPRAEVMEICSASLV